MILDVDARLHPLDQQPQHRVVGRLRVVDQQLLACAGDEPREAVARILGADDEAFVAGRVRQTVEVGGKELVRFVDQLPVLADDAEAPALGDVEAGEVEAVDMQDLVVDDHHLAVIADKVVGGARHGDTGLEQRQFQFAQALGAAAIGVRRQRAHAHAAGDRGRERVGNLEPIEAKDEDVDALLRLPYRRDDRGDAGVRLYDEFHSACPAG